MTKLHELLAAEKTPTAAWHKLFEDTLKKFKNPNTFFEGFSKSLKMLDDSGASQVLEAQAREERPVTTTVWDTLEYAFDIFKNAENLQMSKNMTNQRAVGTVEWEGEPFLVDMPVDELLGLEARLAKIRELFEAMPTLDASREWVPADQIGHNVWQVRYPEETSKTEKIMVPVVLAPATDKHPAQVKESTKDQVIGKFTTIKRSGSVTALQKAESIKRIDALIVEVKKARMRANETPVADTKYAGKIVELLMEPLASK